MVTQLKLIIHSKSLTIHGLHDCICEKAMSIFNHIFLPLFLIKTLLSFILMRSDFLCPKVFWVNKLNWLTQSSRFSLCLNKASHPQNPSNRHLSRSYLVNTATNASNHCKSITAYLIIPLWIVRVGRSQSLVCLYKAGSASENIISCASVEAIL